MRLAAFLPGQVRLAVGRMVIIAELAASAELGELISDIAGKTGKLEQSSLLQICSIPESCGEGS